MPGSASASAATGRPDRLDVGQASSLGAWRLLHGLRLYGAVSWKGPDGLRLTRPDTYGPFAYYAYMPFAAVFPPAPLRGWAHPLSAVLATLLLPAPHRRDHPSPIGPPGLIAVKRRQAEGKSLAEIQAELAGGAWC